MSAQQYTCPICGIFHSGSMVGHICQQGSGYQGPQAQIVEPPWVNEIRLMLRQIISALEKK